MTKKRVTPKTAALLGVIGSLAGVLAGALMAAGLSQARYAVTASFIFYGVMLLFLSQNEPGTQNRARRIKIFLLFLALLFSYFDLPLLCPALEAIVLPLFALLYRSWAMRPRFFTLVAFEALYFVIRTIAITPTFEPYTAHVVGATLIAVSVLRFMMLIFLRTQFVNDEAERP